MPNVAATVAFAMLVAPPSPPQAAEYEVVEATRLAAAGEYRGSGRIVLLESGAAKAFHAMQAAAREADVGLVPISGFRTHRYQALLFERAVARHGSEQHASRWVAEPGRSEHHTGRALDVGDQAHPGCDVRLCFDQTPAYRWLDEHAGGFGFVLSFPRDLPEASTPGYEPWHWRYVGD